jgi:hypothetical protein
VLAQPPVETEHHFSTKRYRGQSRHGSSTEEGRIQPGSTEPGRHSPHRFPGINDDKFGPCLDSGQCWPPETSSRRIVPAWIILGGS